MNNKLELTGWEYLKPLYNDLKDINSSEDFIHRCVQHGITLHTYTWDTDLNNIVALFEDKYLHLYDGNEEKWWQLFLDTKLSDYTNE